MPYYIRVKQEFSAAHFLRDYHGKCESVHGHNYVVEVTIVGEKLKPPGMVEDFVAVKKTLRRLLPDHKSLNEVFTFNPTAENLARHFYEQLARKYRVTKVAVWENAGSCAEYTAQGAE